MNELLLKSISFVLTNDAINNDLPHELFDSMNT